MAQQQLGPTPIEVLRGGVASLRHLLSPDGALNDPVFDAPTQYGTAYYGWCCAVLAGLEQPGSEQARATAQQALVFALAHTADPARRPHASGFDRATLSIRGWLNHRDFTWPPILKTHRALEKLGATEAGVADRLASVNLDAVFRMRPPSNWAAVWMSGEWLRMEAGLSPTTVEQFDGWIDTFFDEVLDLRTGMFCERGLPNSYDLFTRTHFTDLLLQGYRGRNRERLEQFLTTGLGRSLTMQLSDGSLASGYRSTGQTWVLGAEIALFTASRSLGLGTVDQQAEAGRAAWRAFASLASWQRPEAPFSPVQNLLDPTLRVGYEGYTADGHYSPLALAFLASAIAAGFGTDDPQPAAPMLDQRSTVSFAEGPPTYRAVAHLDRTSVAVQTQADGVYDANGLVDLTFGAGRLLHFVSSARHLSGGPWLNPGLAVRAGSGAAEVTALCGRRHRLVTEAYSDRPGTLCYATAVLPEPEHQGDDLLAEQSYAMELSMIDGGLRVREATPGRRFHRSLLIPYLRDLGGPTTTQVSFSEHGVRFQLDDEWVEFNVVGMLERRTDLRYGYESRRGLCGLVRLDLADPAAELDWSVASSPS